MEINGIIIGSVVGGLCCIGSLIMYCRRRADIRRCFGSVKSVVGGLCCCACGLTNRALGMYRRRRADIRRCTPAPEAQAVQARPGSPALPPVPGMPVFGRHLRPSGPSSSTDTGDSTVHSASTVEH